MPVDAAKLVCAYESADTSSWATFLGGGNDALAAADVMPLTAMGVVTEDASKKELAEEMTDTAAGIAELRSKLAAVDEEWAARSGASYLVLESASALKSDERGGGVHEHTSRPGLLPGTREDGGGDGMHGRHAFAHSLFFSHSTYRMVGGIVGRFIMLAGVGIRLG